MFGNKILSMKIITDEQLTEIIFLINNHQMMVAKKKLLSLEDLPEEKEETKS